MRIGISETRAKFCGLVKLAQNGAAVIVTRRGKAVVKIVTVRAQPKAIHVPDLVGQALKSGTQLARQLGLETNTNRRRTNGK